MLAEVAEADLGDLQADRAGLDLGEVEDVVDEREKIRAGGVDRLRELALLVREVAFRVLGQELRQDQQRVQRRAQLVAHVGEELRLVARGQRQLLGLLLERRLGERDLAVLGLDLALLQLEQARLLLQLLVRGLELVLLLAQELFRLAQRRGLLLQALVGLLELLLLALQLAGEELGLLEQPFGAHVRRDRVEHDADRLGELVEEGLVGLREAAERGELDHRLDLLLEQHRQDDDVERRRLAERRADADVVARHMGQEDALLLERALGRRGPGACGSGSRCSCAR